MLSTEARQYLSDLLAVDDGENCTPEVAAELAALAHVHAGLTPDNDVCTTCNEIVCAGCGATLAYEVTTDTYIHPAPMCGLHMGMGSKGV